MRVKVGWFADGYAFERKEEKKARVKVIQDEH